MTLAMAIELGEYGIRVNGIGPGVTHTYKTELLTDPDTYRTTAGRIPLRRYGTPSDYAAMVAFLASNEADYVTGQVIYVDGGITAQLSPPGGRALEKDDFETTVTQPTEPERNEKSDD
jgi:NAD(P)-dependent dehydrogenase (short-subunit alcohol dehydrogenase family)